MLYELLNLELVIYTLGIESEVSITASYEKIIIHSRILVELFACIHMVNLIRDGQYM